MPENEQPQEPQPPKLTAKERAEKAEQELAETREQLGNTIGLLERMEGRVAAMEGRLDEAPTPTPIEGEATQPTAQLDGKRCFVNPQAPNSTYLISYGEVEKVRDPASPTGYRDNRRKDDVQIRFRNGVWFSQSDGDWEKNDEKRIAWCEAHPELVHDVMDEMTSVWFELKKGQVDTSTKKASFSPRIDVDKAMAGDIQELTGTGGGVVESARQQLVAAKG